MNVGRVIIPIVMVAYGMAAFLGLTVWFPLTGSTPDWFPTLEVALSIVIVSGAIGVARGRRWGLLTAVALGLMALAWTATWLGETLSWYVKVAAVVVPLTVVAYAVTVVRGARDPGRTSTPTG